ncbi:MAG TPA: hypothetical protein VN703_02840 [Candidatus Sulfopaludibacter sp.]|nr:hypothetical protein [Candidatus Sulfopaludibacter sp.]
MKTNTNEFKAIIAVHLFDRLNDIENELKTPNEVAKYSYERFNGEYNHDYNKKRLPNLQNRVADYLQGLPFQLEFENYRIIELAKKWEQLPKNADDRQEDKILNNYWNFMAFQILKFWKANSMDISKLY